MSKTSECSDHTSGSTRIPVVLTLLVAGLFLVVPAMAHAPQDIDVVYDPASEKLMVTITHIVDDPTTHYLNKVQVKHNGRVISDPDYKSQPEKDTFTYTYDLRASPPDIFWVYTTCVRGGSRDVKYEIPYPVAAATAAPEAAAPMAPAAEVPTTQQSPVWFLLPLLALAILLIRRS